MQKKFGQENKYIKSEINILKKKYLECTINCTTCDSETTCRVCSEVDGVQYYLN